MRVLSTRLCRSTSDLATQADRSEAWQQIARGLAGTGQWEGVERAVRRANAHGLAAAEGMVLAYASQVHRGEVTERGLATVSRRTLGLLGALFQVPSQLVESYLRDAAEIGVKAELDRMLQQLRALPEAAPQLLQTVEAVRAQMGD